MKLCAYCDGKVISWEDCPSKDQMIEMGGEFDEESEQWFHNECFEEVRPGSGKQ